MALSNRPRKGIAAAVPVIGALAALALQPSELETISADVSTATVGAMAVTLGTENTASSVSDSYSTRSVPVNYDSSDPSKIIYVAADIAGPVDGVVMYNDGTGSSSEICGGSHSLNEGIGDISVDESSGNMRLVVNDGSPKELTFSTAGDPSTSCSSSSFSMPSSSCTNFDIDPVTGYVACEFDSGSSTGYDVLFEKSSGTTTLSASYDERGTAFCTEDLGLIRDDSTGDIYWVDVTGGGSITKDTTLSAVTNLSDISCNANYIHYSKADGTIYYRSLSISTDADSDGFNSDEDCNDSDASINPDADEVCDGVDNNCDEVIDDDAIDRSTVYVDADGDGIGGDTSELACSVEEGYSATTGDCDDTNASASDWETGYVDADGDGFGGGEAGEYCPMPEGVVTNNDDCDDSDGDVWQESQCAASGETSQVLTGETVHLTDGGEVTGSGAVLEVASDGSVSIDVEPGGYVFGTTFSPLIASYDLKDEELANSGEVSFPATGSGNDFEIFGGAVEGAESNATGSGSSNGLTTTSGLDTDYTSAEGSEDYNQDTGYAEFLDASMEAGSAESNSGADSEFNECDPEGNQILLTDAGPDMDWTYLCVKSSVDGVAFGADLPDTPVYAGQMHEVADIYPCVDADGETGTPEDTGTPTEKNTPGGSGERPGSGCSTTQTTPTGGLVVMTGFLLAAAGRRRKED